MPKLVVKHPQQGDVTFTLKGERVTVGRRADNAIQINHGTVSAHHAEFVSINGHYILRDLDSTNHCFVNGGQILEAPLKNPCKVTIGTVECEYVPDDAAVAAGTPTEAGDLRKTIGILREQNEVLISKLTEQQKQIDILGSARLLTPATGADINSLRAQIVKLTSERDALSHENKTLQEEVKRLRGIAALTGDSVSMKETVRISLPPEPDLPRANITVLPDGGPVASAPIAKVVAKVAAKDEADTPFFEQVAKLNDKLRPLASLLTSQPEDMDARNEMLVLCSRMAEQTNTVSRHPVGRLVLSLESLLRDLAHRPGAIEPGLLRTITQAVDFLATLLTPEVLARSNNLPEPSILALDDDKDLLPAIAASLEFAHLSTTTCGDAKEALNLMNEGNFDLLLLDIGLPDADGHDICSSIRKIPAHAKTPIVFLTGHDTLESRAQSSLSGGTDFIGKPFNMFELTVKANTWVFKNQLGLI